MKKEERNENKKLKSNLSINFSDSIFMHNVFLVTKEILRLWLAYASGFFSNLF